MFEIEKYEPFGFEQRDQNISTLKSVTESLESVDTSNLNQVADARKFVVKLRGLIQKQGKALREEAIAKQKRVLSEEKEYVEMLTPYEEKFKQVEAEEKERELREARKKLLPWRKEQLQAVEAEMSDDDILAMDDTEFTNRIVEIKEQKEAEKQREEEMKKREAEAAERAVKEAEEKAQREKEEAERKEKEEADRLAKQKEYKKWLAENGYNEETKNQFIAKDMGTEVHLYKLVGTYKKQ